MKRTIHPFAVEYKRRAKRSQTAEAPSSIWKGRIGEQLRGSLARIEANDETTVEDASASSPAVLGRGSDAKPARSATQRILEVRTEPSFPELPTSNLVLPDWMGGVEVQDLRDANPPSESLSAVSASKPEPRAVRSVPLHDDAVSKSQKRPVEVAHTYSARRRSQTKGLDLHERWKWDLSD